MEGAKTHAYQTEGIHGLIGTFVNAIRHITALPGSFDVIVCLFTGKQCAYICQQNVWERNEVRIRYYSTSATS